MRSVGFPTPTASSAAAPRPIDDADRVAGSARSLDASAARLRSTVDDVARAWAPLEGQYRAPEAMLAALAMQGPQRQAAAVARLSQRAADVVLDYSGELRRLATWRARLVTEQHALDGRRSAALADDASDGHVAAQWRSMLAEHQQEVARFNADAEDTELDCATRLRALKGMTWDQRARTGAGAAVAMRAAGGGRGPSGTGYQNRFRLSGPERGARRAIPLALSLAPGMNAPMMTLDTAFQAVDTSYTFVDARNVMQKWSKAKWEGAPPRVEFAGLRSRFDQTAQYVGPKRAEKYFREQGLWKPGLSKAPARATGALAKMRAATGPLSPVLSKVLGPLGLATSAKTLWDGVQRGDIAQMLEGTAGTFSGGVFTVAAFSAAVAASPALLTAAAAAGAIAVGISLWRNRKAIANKAREGVHQAKKAVSKGKEVLSKGKDGLEKLGKAGWKKAVNVFG